MSNNYIDAGVSMKGVEESKEPMGPDSSPIIHIMVCYKHINQFNVPQLP